jgi:hypothetical protein
MVVVVVLFEVVWSLPVPVSLWLLFVLLSVPLLLAAVLIVNVPITASPSLVVVEVPVLVPLVVTESPLLLSVPLSVSLLVDVEVSEVAPV